MADRDRGVDLLRGLVMALMALDHARDYFGPGGDPMDFFRTTPALFATRWVTHLCAPVFVVLAGVSAHYVAQRRGRAATARFLVTRGLWLIVLELTIVRAAWMFALEPPVFSLMVIWALGVCMIALAGLIWLPRGAVAAIGLAMVAGHNLVDGVNAAGLGDWAPVWSILHERGTYELGGATIRVVYPVVPWIGVMALGWAVAPWLAANRTTRGRALVIGGLAALAAFIVLRWTGVYGDAMRWYDADATSLSVMSFLHVTKYPPSLCYLLATLGIASLLLAAFDAAGARLQPLAVFGRVPLFFYVAHLYVIHGAAELIALWSPPPPDAWTLEWSLPALYGAWLGALAVLYPLCQWFAGVKARRRAWWLSYL